MGTNAKLFWILAVFFFLADAIYTAWALIDTGQVEWVGTLAIGLCGVLSAFLAFYLHKHWKAQGGELPEDLPDSEIDDGDPELGHFSPWSWWPIFLAGGLALVFLGLGVGAWVALIGAPLALIAVVGWVYEYYRGYFAR